MKCDKIATVSTIPWLEKLQYFICVQWEVRVKVIKFWSLDNLTHVNTHGIRSPAFCHNKHLWKHLKCFLVIIPMSLICDAHDALLCSNEDHRTFKLNVSKTKVNQLLYKGFRMLEMFSFLLSQGPVRVYAITFAKFDTDKILNITVTQFVQL